MTRFTYLIIINGIDLTSTQYKLLKEGKTD